MQHQFVQLDDNALDQLQQDPRNEVYRYRDTPGVSQDLDQVLVDLRDLWQTWREHEVKSPEEAEELRRCLLREARWRDFKKRTAHVWNTMTRHDTGEKQLAVVHETIELVRRSQRGEFDLNTGRDQLRGYIGANFGVPEEEYRRQHPDATITSLSGFQ